VLVAGRDGGGVVLLERTEKGLEEVGRVEVAKVVAPIWIRVIRHEALSVRRSNGCHYCLVFSYAALSSEMC
jgi:hypothetical protein